MDATMFSWGPMRMSLADYAKDIGLVYAMIPIVTTGLAAARARRASTAQASNISTCGMPSST
jgi:hypothetical protein